MSELNQDIRLTKRYLKDRLQNNRTNFRGHQEKWQNIYDIMKRCGEEKESNSLLLIGPRGSGKTTLINSVIETLLTEEVFYKNTLIVNLNGYFHTDDKLALKSATLQMNLENCVDGKIFGSVAENLAFLLECLRSGNKDSKSIIFIIEEFDLFCSHQNQTLLYNLFDVSQSAQAPICVFGLTCRLDVIELLEKRVKSRYSHRQIFLFPENDDFNKRITLFKDLMKLENPSKLKKSIKKPNLSYMETAEIYFLRNLFDEFKYKFNKAYIKKWNEKIDELIENSAVRKCLQGIFDFDTNEDYFKTFLYRLVSGLKDNHKYITVDDITSLYLLYSPNYDEKVLLLLGLSILELSLVISMKHHSEIYDCDPFNFEIIYSRFLKFAKTSRTMQDIERMVALKAFEHLKNLELILPLNNGKKVQKEFEMHKMALIPSQINQCVTNYVALPTELSQWASSSLF